jgi:hypothetical protein
MAPFSFTVKYWAKPRRQHERLSKAEERSRHLQSQIIDKPCNDSAFYGVLLFHTSDGKNIDIRANGIKDGYLRLIEYPSWHNDNRELSAVRIASRPPKKQSYKDLRGSTVTSFSACWIEVTVPADKVGLVIGAQRCRVNKLEDDFGVKITTPAPTSGKASFTLRGDSEENLRSAAREIESIVNDSISTHSTFMTVSLTPSSAVTISNTHFNDCDLTIEQIFLKGQSKLSDMVIIGAKSIVSYCIAATLCDENTIYQVVLDVELMGLQAITTRGCTSSWVNSADTSTLVADLQRYCGWLVGSRGRISMEALGYSKGGRSRNIHTLLFDSSRRCINEDIIRKGLCKILQSARYYDPIKGKRCDPVRVFFPYYSNLLKKEYESNGLSWCRTEFKILEAERLAASEGLGIWAKYGANDDAAPPPQPFIPRLPTDGRRFIFVDNSNIWITAKNFSGEHQPRQRLQEEPESLPAIKRGTI